MAFWGFHAGSVVKNLPALQEMQETWIQSLGWEDPLEEEMAAHSSILAGKSHKERWATVHGVAESQTLLSMHSHSSCLSLSSHFLAIPQRIEILN